MAPEMVIAIYRPRAGQEEALAALVAEHLPLLRARGLATDRPGIVMRSKEDGTILEVFEWVSADGSRRAHEDPAVARVWEACTFTLRAAVSAARSRRSTERVRSRGEDLQVGDRVTKLQATAPPCTCLYGSTKASI